MYYELTDKELNDSYVEYTLLYDTIANRISIEDVQAKDGRLRLMENVWWSMTSSPICSLPEEPAAERLISS